MIDDESRLAQLSRLWAEHQLAAAPSPGVDPRLQEVVLYAAWVGSMVEVALRKGALDANLAQMLRTRQAEGNELLFRAGGELGEPARSFLSRVLVMEEILAALPVA